MPVEAVLVLLGAVFTGPTRHVAWALAAVIPLLALLIGPSLRGLDRPRGWRMLGLAGLLLLVGEVAALKDDMRGYISLPSTLDFVSSAAYPIAAVAVLVITMRGSPLLLWARLVDTFIVLTALSLITWTLLVVPLAGHSLPAASVRVYAVTFALGDALILVVLGRLLYPHPRRAPAAVWVLLFGTLFMLASDMLFSFVELDALHAGRDSPIGVASAVIWLVGFGAWGAAALWPATGSIVQTMEGERPFVPKHSMTLLVGAALTPVLVVVVYGITGRRGEGVVLAMFGTVTALLLITRLSLTLAQAEDRLSAEQTLGAAAHRLVSASDPSQILGTVVDAAVKLAGRDPVIVAAAEDDGNLLALGNEAGLWTDEHPSEDPSAVPAARRTPAAWVDARLGERPHVTFGAPAPAAPDATPLALGVCEAPGGLGERVGPLRLLVAQAALALSRMRLNREVSRREGEAYFRALVDDASDAIVIVEESGRVRYASPSAAQLFGTEDLTDLEPEELFGRDNAAWVGHMLAELPGQGGVATRTHWIVDRVGGGRYEVEVACSDLRENPAVHGLVLTLRDVTAERRLERELRHHAYHDRLTGMPNRLRFTRRVELTMATSHVPGPVPTVLLIDLDDFRELNEVHGREVGDLVLISLSERLTRVPGVVEAARLDSDTFALLAELPDESKAACVESAERASEAISAPYDVPGGPITVSATIGIAQSPGEPRAEEVMRNSRLALEAAKAAGRGAIRCYSPTMLAARLDHARLHRDLETAIAQGDLLLHYQPVVDLSVGAITSFEALVRWPHPERGIIPPDHFIPLAEETGLIVPLGRWIVHRAARDAAALRTVPGAHFIRVAVNVSARQFATPGLTETIRGGLAEAGLEPSALVVELTESALIRRGEETGAAHLDELRELGVGLAIDDFGTGYSSLSYLHELPFDALKIDKSFIGEITESPRRMRLVRGIIELADALGLDVIAEGLEHEHQRILLTDAGCAYGQGFLFSPPVPLPDARAMLHKRGSAGFL